MALRTLSGSACAPGEGPAGRTPFSVDSGARGSLVGAMETLVFGYGSLVHRASLERGLRRPVRPGDVVPTRLRDRARVWGTAEHVFSAGLGREVRARFLDLVPRVGASVNGVLVRVSEGELAAMRIREKTYALEDVTELVVERPEGVRVVAFASPAGRVFDGECVLSEYVRLVEEGFASFGAAFLDEFRSATETPPVQLVEGTYRFVDPEQNRLTTRADEAF